MPKTLYTYTIFTFAFKTFVLLSMQFLTCKHLMQAHRDVNKISNIFHVPIISNGTAAFT